MKSELVYFDLYPKVVPCGKTARIHVKPRSRHVRFEENKTYYVYVIPMHERARDVYHPDYPVLEVAPSEGCLTFDFAFGAEQQYELWLCDRRVTENNSAAWRGARRNILHLYALEADLFALRPLRGNLHIHSFRSDGVEAPEVVAAWYRRAGYDFIALTDHRQYAPSLEAMDAYRDAPLDMLLLPGEEVHATDNLVHIINFGGTRSVNDIYRDAPEQYAREVADIQASQAVPEGVCAFEAASSEWVFREIKKADGVSILCHPNWIYWGAYNQPPAMYRYFLEKRGFDVLELINGGNHPYENQFQLAEWYNTGRDGERVPVVGADDSHGAVNGEWFDIGKTYLLAPANARADVLSALKRGLCCAAEQYHGECERLYGSARLVEYFTFLREEYFPLHDELCVEEGRLMLAYANDEQNARARLALCRGQTEALYRRLWNV